MMGKKKLFQKVDLTVPGIEHNRDLVGNVSVFPDVIPPQITNVKFPRRNNASQRANFDFKQWYHVGIDPITYAFQRQTERFLQTHDNDLSTTTVVTYCENGARHFLSFCALVSKAKARSLELTDINRELIDQFLCHLADGSKEAASQRIRYKNTKAILVALGKRGLITVIPRGENATFPKNPFPNSHLQHKAAKPLTTAQRKAFAQAVKTAVMPLFRDDIELTSELLGYALLVVALHTGRNTTPLLELNVDCLLPHPSEHLKILTLHKRRGLSDQRVPVRDSTLTDSTSTVLTGVVRIIERVKALTSFIRPEASDHLKDRLWIYRSRRSSRSTWQGQVVALNEGTLGIAIEKLVADYSLKDSNGEPLRINVSILRKTFSNRIYEILDGDIVAAAHATGNTPRVAGDHYMRPGESAHKNWKFMGQAMQQELSTGTLGATEKTPTGRCSDITSGQFSPKNGATCMNFTDCLRCRNYVVTGDDLYRLFSFYWLVVKEKNRVDKRKWERHYAHIIRLIDRDVVQHGIQKKIFSAAQVEAERERARLDPHPFWSTPTRLEELA